MLQKAKLEKKISGIKIYRGAPKVNHLLFADDSMLFYKANMQENEVVQSILKKYEMVSSQKVNREKNCYGL